MDIHDYLGVLRRGVVLIVLGILLGLAGGYAAQTMEKPSYSATSRELLTNKVAGDLSISQGRIASYVLVASSGLVLQPVIDQLGLDSTVEDLARRITVVAPPNTVIIEITATAATAEEAQDIANTVSAQFGEVVADQLETTTGVTPTTAATPTPGPDGEVAPAPKPSPSVTRLPNGTVVPITPPTAPVRVVNLEQAALPAAPNPSNGPLLMLVGGVLGLALGLLAASLREAVDRRVRTPRDVARVTEVPVVGSIVSDRRMRTDRLTARAGSRSPSAESFRALRAHLDHLRARDGRRVVVVTAAGRGQGATSVAANLALAMANTGTSVVVVDADLRSGAGLSALFSIDGRRGLADVLAGRADLDAVLRAAGTPNLTVLPSGAAVANAGELLATPRMRSLLAELTARYEVVVLDTPAIASASDASVLGALAGSTLLVVAQGATTRPRLDDALALLEAGGSEPVGIVLTRTRRPVAGRMPAVTPSHAAPLPSDAVPATASPVPAVAAPVAPPAELPDALEEPVKEPSHLADPLPTAAPVEPRPQRPRTASRRVTTPVTTTAVVAAPVPRAPDTTEVVRTADVVAPAAPAPARVSRRVSQPVISAPVVSAPVVSAPVVQTAPVAEPAAASAPMVTDVEHTVGTARELDFAFAALPTATAAEQRAGALLPEIESSKPAPIDRPIEGAVERAVERPIVIRPDAARPVSRFAPDPSRLVPRLSGAYASAPAPSAGTAGRVPEAHVAGTVVNTVSIRVQQDVIESATVPPPIRHILPRPGATVPPKVIEAARAAQEAEPEPEPEFVEVRPRTGPVPVPPLARELGEPVPVAPAPRTPLDDDRTAETRAIPIAGSLLGEIGGLPRVEVRAARPVSVTDTAPNPEREARESYEQRARQLERVAHERLMREQQRLAADMREQLAHDKRELESVLDNRLEDTVLRPRRVLE